MDAIADTTIARAPGLGSHAAEDSPSLLALIIETNPLYWAILKDQANLKQVIQSIVVALNAHLAINNSNKVVVIAAHSTCAKYLFPSPDTVNDINTGIAATSASSSSTAAAAATASRNHNTNGNTNGFGSTNGNGDAMDGRSISPTPDVYSESQQDSKRHLKSKNIYRQFKIVDETILDALESLLNETVPDKTKVKSTMPGALSLALTYINRVRQVNDGLAMSARMLVMSVSDDSSMSYIPTMNSIFAAQGMKIPMDICKLGNHSTFLQQAADVTGGIYLLVKNPQGLIQYLSTVFFIEPSIRNYVALPVNNDIDFRASCFATGRIVDIGYVCSVCLCVLSEIPKNEICPTCDSKFDPQALEKLRRKPVVKKKTINANGSTNNTPTPSATPKPA